jgi:two-component system chemotaxis response regulator CheY
MGSKVVVVDDSRTARTQVRNALSGGGYDIVEALNGRDGLAKLAEHPQAALVICDVNMPIMSGLEMLEQMKADKARAAVLMLTTEADPELQRRARRMGVAGWILKPFNPAVLLQTVRALLRDG